jgi:hypothetical protein
MTLLRGVFGGSVTSSGGEINTIDGVCDLGHTCDIREYDSKGRETTPHKSNNNCEGCGCSGSNSSY